MAGKGNFPAVVLMALALATAAPRAVQGEGQSGGPAPEEKDPVAIYVEAGAGPDQIVKIRELSKDFEELARVRWQLMVNLKKDMQDLALQPDPQEKSVLAKQEEINKVFSEMASERIKLMLKIRNILTTVQKEKLVELMSPKKTATQGGPFPGGGGDTGGSSTGGSRP